MNSLGFILLMLCWLMYGVSVCANAEPAPPGQPTRIVLLNGVRLLLKPEPETERAAVSLFVGMTPDASPNDAAVGEMVARTLFYGNANRTQNSIQALVGEVGGSLDVLRTPELVAINYVTVPSQLPEALHLLCDCLKYASFAPESLHRALQTIHEERQTGRETALARGQAEINRLLGQGEPGEDQLLRVTQTQAREYFQRHYVPAQTVISVVGHFDLERIQGLLNAFLADYNRPAPFRRSAAANILPEALPASHSFLPVSGAVAYAFVGTAAPSAGSADYPAFTVLQAILGGGHASRLFRQAREILGVGYDVGAFYPAERFPTLLTYLQWSPRRNITPNGGSPDSETILKMLNGELDNVSANPPNEDELKRARNVAVGQDALRHERARDRAFLLGWYETSGLGFAYDTEFPRRLSQVTREDVLRVAKTYLSGRANVLLLPASP